MNRINNSDFNNRKRTKRYVKEDDEGNINKSKREKTSNKNRKKEVSQEKKNKGIKGFFIKLFLIILIVLIIIGLFFYRKTQKNGGGIKGALITFFGTTVEEIESLENINILLLGISEDIDSELTDTIILCSYNPQKQSVSMISIPRDTFVGKSKANAKGSDKINSLYAKSPEKLLNKVSTIIGVDIEYYAVIKTESLIEMVDIIGGVNFEVPIDMDYDDPTQDLHIHLRKGMQKIDGEKAEQLLRFRHNNDGTSYPANYGDNDYGRMKTQREFMAETIKQTVSFKNIFKSKKIIDAIFENIETNLEMDNLLIYIPTAVNFDVNNIINNQLPGKSEKCNNLWFFVHDKIKTKDLVETLEIK